MLAYPVSDTATLPLDPLPANSDIAVAQIDAGAEEEYLRPDLGSFVRRHRWTEDARHRIPFSPERFDEDADAMARAIRELRLHVEALDHETIAALTARIILLERQQIDLKQLRIDLDVVMVKNAADVTRNELAALLSGGIDAGNIDLTGANSATGTGGQQGGGASGGGGGGGTTVTINNTMTTDSGTA